MTVQTLTGLLCLVRAREREGLRGDNDRYLCAEGDGTYWVLDCVPVQRCKQQKSQAFYRPDSGYHQHKLLTG